MMMIMMMTVIIIIIISSSSSCVVVVVVVVVVVAAAAAVNRNVLTHNLDCISLLLSCHVLYSAYVCHLVDESESVFYKFTS